VAPRALPVAALTAACLAGCSAAENWAMPDVVGSDLQAAQDTVQRLTGFRVAVTTHDETGANRTQVYDHEWQVCTQSVAAGSDLAPDAMVDLGVVARGESC